MKSWHDEFMNKTSVSDAIRIDHIDGRTVFITIGETWHKDGGEFIVIGRDGDSLLCVDTVVNGKPVSETKTSRSVNYFCFASYFKKGKLPLAGEE